jgi:mono/diheme cytochrome c family protein
MSPTSLRLVSALAFAATFAVAVDAHAQNIERGRELYENHCQTCHTVQVHGRKNRMALSASDLREIVERWQRNQKLGWNREDVEDVVQYLGTTRYFFSSALER